jgi:hypothetical protein
MNETVTTQFETKPWNFERRLVCARNAPNQTDTDQSFLIDVNKRYRQYGPRMFLSDRQRAYLQGMAVRGGWRTAMDQDEPYYPFREAAACKA